ncbi:hypothetical protein NA57DRAFT_57106 [Rhizodiscina lignyota]|uniref:C2H2-type domain-containing protein n=1 Tax=Rhizodiscina lignyota TaxID=1504668 RepID=A0A9P4M5D2_9PEZI|nr:hypothetical protein NA57DRAFT_57106 [Rhizodiscina lignyota]
MAPRYSTNPAPITESAKEALKSFYCNLCNKGYSRSTEFEQHESSYDHQHKKRLTAMKRMQRDPNAAEKARRAERKADEKAGLLAIKPIKIATSGTSKAGAGFTKAGFKSAFTPVSDGVEETGKPAAGFKRIDAGDEKVEEAAEKAEAVASDEDTEDEWSDYSYEAYDPSKPLDCGPECPCGGWPDE